MLADQLLHPFDFDAWMNLAKVSPREFEEYRQLVIEHTIQSYGNSLHLRRLQFRIDAERFRARTPLNACLRLSALMWDEFLDLNSALHQFTHGCLNAEPKYLSVTEGSSAKVIPFHRH